MKRLYVPIVYVKYRHFTVWNSRKYYICNINWNCFPLRYEYYISRTICGIRTRDFIYQLYMLNMDISWYGNCRKKYIRCCKNTSIIVKIDPLSYFLHLLLYFLHLLLYFLHLLSMLFFYICRLGFYIVDVIFTFIIVKIHPLS